MPSKIELNFYESDVYRVEFAFFNTNGEVDAIYEITPDDCLKTIFKNDSLEILVPKGTDKIANPVKKWFYFEKDLKGNKTCYLTIRARPVNESGKKTFAIIPVVSVKVEIFQPKHEISQPSKQESKSKTSSIGHGYKTTETTNISKVETNRSVNETKVNETTVNETATTPIEIKDNETKVVTDMPLPEEDKGLNISPYIPYLIIASVVIGLGAIAFILLIRVY